MCNHKENHCKHYKNYNSNSHCYYNNYPTMYQYNAHNSIFLKKISGTLDTICDGKENFVVDSGSFAGSLSVTVRGDCPAQIWIYYLDSFYKRG